MLRSRKSSRIKVTGAAVAVALAFAGLFPTPGRSAWVPVAPGGGPHVRLFNASGNLQSQFFAYGGGFPGGVRAAGMQADSGGEQEVVTGPGPSGGPHVRVWGAGGNLRSQFFAYDPGFSGGVHVAAGDIDGDGIDEIVTGAGPGGGPHVRVWTPTGGLVAQFFAYHPAFSGGVRVAAADLTGDGRAEIVTAAGPGGGPHVRVWNADGSLRSEWFAYDAAFRGGVLVAAGNVSGRSVVTGAGAGGGPHVRVWSPGGGVRSEFFAYDAGFRGGVQVAVGDVGGESVVTGAGQGGGPHVRVFTAAGGVRNQWFAYGSTYSGGVNVGVANGGVVTGAGAERLYEHLRRGDRGPGVAAAQRRLTDLGYWLGPVDGNYSILTEQAVTAFQKVHGMPRTGELGLREQDVLAVAGRPVPGIGGNLVEVDLARQVLFVVRNGQAAFTFNTATGRSSAQTPSGMFTFMREINGVRHSHLGRLYRPKYFTTRGHAVHGAHSVPPFPASSGCVRLTDPAMDFVWSANLMPLGSRIWIH